MSCGSSTTPYPVQCSSVPQEFHELLPPTWGQFTKGVPLPTAPCNVAV